MRFHLLAEEPEGREVYAVALTTQIQIDPALRVYDDAERERLVELFGPPERWGATTHSFQWARVESLVPSFTGSTPFALEVPCTYDLEVASAKYFDALDDGDVPLSFHFNGTVLYRGAGRPAAGRARAVELLGAVADAGRRSGGARSTPTTRAAAGSGCSARRWRRSARRKAERGLHTFDDTVRELL